jgi:hypothetical protein
VKRPKEASTLRTSTKNSMKIISQGRFAYYPEVKDKEILLD